MKKLFTLIAALVMFAGVAKAVTYNLDTHDCQIVTNDSYNVIMYGFYTNWGTFIFTFDGTDEVEIAQTYTLDDMNDDYTYLYSGGYSFSYTAASFLKVAEGTYVLSATLAGQTEDYVFNINVTPRVPITTILDTVRTTINGRIYNGIADEGMFQLYGSNSDYEIYFAVNATQIAGTYVDTNVIPQYTALFKIVGTDTTMVEWNSLCPNAYVTGDASNVSATINFVGVDSVLYIVTFEYADPTPETEQTFNSSSLVVEYDEYNDYYELYYGVSVYDVIATDANLGMTMVAYFYDYTGDRYATYSVADTTMELYLVDATNYEEVEEVFSASLTLGGTDAAATLTGSALCYSNTQYNINCTGVVPVENVEASDYEVYNEGRVIVLNGAEGQNAAIYDIAGRMISNTTVNSDNARFEVAAAGVYVVRVNGQNFRVVVK